MSGEREAIISVRGLSTGFGRHVVHENLDLDVYRGEVIGVVGGSGTGKSVLLRAIVGLLRPRAGTIRVFGQNVLDTSPAEFRALRSRWGVMFQDGALFSSLTVRQNVEAPMREQVDLSDGTRAALAAIKVRMAGLPEDALGKYPSELSGGMRKRAGFARAIALDPDIVFLDEPTAGLDPIGAAAFDQMTLQLRAALGLTVFLVTHDLDSLNTICDRVAVLAERRVLATGTLDELRRIDHPWVNEYFNGPRARAAMPKGAPAAGRAPGAASQPGIARETPTSRGAAPSGGTSQGAQQDTVSAAGSGTEVGTEMGTEPVTAPGGTSGKASGTAPTRDGF